MERGCDLSEKTGSLPVDEALTRAARRRLLRMHHESGVGHIGGNLSVLDCLLVLCHEFLAPQRRLVLSKGHSAGALYIALWSAGRMEESSLATFHRDGTLLAGHPTPDAHEDILFATGSLGHGLPLAAGTAFAAVLRGREDGDHVYCVTSDGEWQEGSTWEGLIFAAHHGLRNLTVLVDHNRLQGFGTTREVASMDPLGDKLRGFDVVVSVIDGHDLAAIRDACAQRHDRAHVVVMDTVKGKGVPFMEGRMEWHYLPLDADRYRSAIDGLTP